MKIGRWQVDTVLEGTFLLDGGSMFGIVPKTLWQRYHPSDANNRIVMALRVLVCRSEDRCIVVDCGLGRRFTGKQEEIYGYTPHQGGLLAGLGRLGIEPEQVTDVVASHLHFDHMGGLLQPVDGGGLEPVFPRARLHVQKECWDWARSPSDWDRASFIRGDFDIWQERLELNLFHGEQEIAPGILAMPAPGHTPGHQIVIVRGAGGGLVFCADLIPTATHVRLPYIMAYDHKPVVTLEQKKLLLARALEEGWILVFEHDPAVVACRVGEKDGRPVCGEHIEL